MIFFIKWIWEMLSVTEERVKYRKNVAELRALTDYELRDIGITRGEIHDVASGVKNFGRV